MFGTETIGEFKFCWELGGTKIKEIYGWVEDKDRAIVKGSSGWFRTEDPKQAASIAASNLGIAI